MSPITGWSFEGVGAPPNFEDEGNYRETVRERANGAGRGLERDMDQVFTNILNEHAQQLQQERYSWSSILKTAAVGVAIDFATMPLSVFPPVGYLGNKIANNLAGPMVLDWLGVDSNIRTSARLGGLLPGFNPLVLEAAHRTREKLWGEATVNVPSIRIKTNPGPKVYG